MGDIDAQIHYADAAGQPWDSMNPGYFPPVNIWDHLRVTNTHRGSALYCAMHDGVSLSWELVADVVLYPSIEQTFTARNSSPATTHTVTLTNLVEGQWILAFATTVVNSALSTPVGFDNYFEHRTNVNSRISADARVVTAADVTASQGAGLDVTWTTASAGESAMAAFAVSGARESINPNDTISLIELDTTGGVNPDPPSLETPWDSTKNLFICGFGAANDGANVTGFPASYTHNTTWLNASGLPGNTQINADVTLGLAARQLDSAVDDPGTFTIDSSEVYSGFTIIVRPL